MRRRPASNKQHAWLIGNGWVSTHGNAPRIEYTNPGVGRRYLQLNKEGWVAIAAQASAWPPWKGQPFSNPLIALVNAELENWGQV